MSPALRREPLANEPASAASCELVSALLAEGGLVAFPTETVYGIGARADRPAALEALRALKERPEEQPFTWHVGSPSALERFPAEELATVRGVLRRLVARYWPGPLTFVLPGTPAGLELVAPDGWCGVRLPAHRGTASLLAACDFPVVLSSANRRGAPPLVDADLVATHFGADVALLLDGGTTPLGESSTVVRLGRGRFEILREGVIGPDQLRSIAGRRMAFVCTGNTCRSPMAEGIARHLIAQRLGTSDSGTRDFGFELVSMGVFAGNGAAASVFAVEVVQAMGIDITGHRSRTAIPEALEGFDHVYCLTSAHLEGLLMKLPPGRGAAIELLDPKGRDVSDPIGGSREDYDLCARRIRECIEARLDDWV